MYEKKIIIIAGGIGGLITAIALNKKGIASFIFEKTKSFGANGAVLHLANVSHPAQSFTMAG